MEKPTFDLVGVILSSFALTGVILATALTLGILLGVVLILRRRRLALPAADESPSLRLDPRQP